MVTLPTVAPRSVLVLWGRPAHRPQLLALLDSDERARYERLRRPDDRARFGTAHALARIAVGELLGQPPETVRFSRRCMHCGQPHGKPQVDPPELHLSLSHSGDRVVVALGCDGAIGVDVERLGVLPDVDLLARKALCNAELRVLQGAAGLYRSRLVLTSWSRKEAALKATGHGLVVPLNDLEVTPATEPPRVVSWTGVSAPAERAHLHDLHPGPNHVATLAVLGGPAPVLVVQHAADDALQHAGYQRRRWRR